jgi:thiol-disulfide isomerase/thioredoxin
MLKRTIAGLILHLLCQIIAISALAEKTRLTGHLGHADVTSVTLYGNIFPSTQVVPVDKKGNFVFETEVDGYLDGLLIVDDLAARIFQEAGDQTTLSIDVSNGLKSLKFGGDRAKENEFLKHFALKYYAEDVVQKMKSLQTDGTPEQFRSFNDSLYVDQQKFLAGFLAITLPAYTQDNITPLRYEGTHEAFIKMIYYDIAFGSLNARIDYGHNYKYYHKKPVEDIFYQGTFLRPDSERMVFQLIDDAVCSKAYMRYVNAFVLHCSDRLGNGLYWKDNGVDPAYSNYRERVRPSLAEQGYFLRKLSLMSRTLEYALAEYIIASFEHYSYEDVAGMYSQFKKDCQDSLLLRRVTKAYRQAGRFASGNPAPAFELLNLQGEKVSLAAFSGKVVYLSFWASWCSPCIGQIREAPKLKELLKNEKDVVFLYISIDEESNKWRAAVEKHAVAGVNLRAAGGYSDPVSLAYELGGGVPKYMIIDRNGNIFDNNAPQPTSGEIAQRRILEALRHGNN